MTKTKPKRPIVFFRVALLVVVSLLLAGIGFGQQSPKATAAAASTVNFQARLLTATGATVPDGNYNVDFKLYSTCSVIASSGGCSTFSSNVWTETRTTNRVRVVNGYLTVNLGSVTAFSGVNWDQELWLTMNIGGTAGSPTWDGEMTPALKLTAVPYAFQAGGLANTNGANRSTLGWSLQTASNAITLPNEGGTICIQNSVNCGFLTSGSAAGSYVQLQGSTPGTPQTGNFNISGRAIAGTALQSPTVNANTLDTISGVTTLNIGTTNASSGINLNQNTTVATNKSLTVLGAAVFRAATDSTTAFQVQNSLNGQVLVVDTDNNFIRLVTGTITNISTASATGAVQIGADNTDNLALDDNEIMARTNGIASTLYLQKLGGGLQIQANNTIVKPGTDTGTTFQVQNSSSVGVLGVDTLGSSVQFGQAASLNGKLVLNNATNSNTVTLQSGTTTTSYALILPTALGASGDCIKDTTGTGILGFGACGTGGGGGGSTMQNSYDNSGTANPQILLNTTNGGLKIRDASGGVTGNILQLQNAAGTATYFGMATTGLTLQDTAGNTAFIFDTSTSHLRIYADGTSPTKYADIYYDGVNNEAVFTASTGTTRIGSGSGNIALQLSNAADVLQATKTAVLGASYSSNDFTFSRNITAGANSLTGSVMKVESTSSGTGTLASNILWVNENNTSATGNLILATTGGSNEKFKVNTSGSVTLAASQSLGTASGTLSVYSGSGDLALTAGGANTVVARAGSNSVTTFQVQNASAAAMLTVDTANDRIQVGSSTTDATARILILDSYNQSSDPTGVNGAMYYNTNMNKFRCYENGAWKNCVYPEAVVILGNDQNANASSSTFQDVTGLAVPLDANSYYTFEAVVPMNVSNATADAKYTFTIPGGATITASGSAPNTTGVTFATCNLVSSGTSCALAVTSAMRSTIIVQGIVSTSATSGNLQFQFAQGTSTAASAPTTMRGATIKYIKQ